MRRSSKVVCACWCPTTGVGPNGNILGNALDGGYGLTPVADHFEAVCEFEGFWGNGTPFRHVYQDMACSEMAKRWAQGTGASWAGLLRQGSFGVVTRGAGATGQGARSHAHPGVRVEERRGA